MRKGDIGYLGGGTEVQVIDSLGLFLVVEVLEDDGAMLTGEQYRVHGRDVHSLPPAPTYSRARMVRR